MNFRTCLIATVCLCLHLIPLSALADIVFLKNGKALKVEKAWQEGGQIWLIYHGVKAGLPLSKVTRIESDSNLRKSDTLKNHNKASQQISDLQSAGKFLPNQIRPTAASVSQAQQAAKPTKTTPVLCMDGFADLKWSARLASINGLEIKQVDSGLKDVIEYVRPSDTLKLGEARLQSIVYAFWRDQLYTVTIWTQGQENYKALRQMVFNKFGKGIRPNPSLERYLWLDSPTTDVMLKHTNDDQYGMLWMRCKELDRKIKLSKLNGHTSYLKLMKSRNRITH